MAERISEFSEPRIGRPALYPWTDWTDGSAWRITRGEDFEISAKSMAVNLHRTAARRGLSVKAQIDGDSIQFRFSEPERAAA